MAPGIFPQARSGLNIILAGGFFQLPAVAQKPLFYNKPVKELKGSDTISWLQTTIGSPLDIGAAVEQALDHLRDDTVTMGNRKLLASQQA
jgi:hypothetical protein